MEAAQLKDEIAYKLLKLIEAEPHLSQREIAEKMGIAEIVATTWAEMKNELECIGERKKNRIFSLSNLSNIDLFYTDHHDDIPTILASNKTILVNPTSRSYKLITKSINHSKIESY